MYKKMLVVLVMVVSVLFYGMRAEAKTLDKAIICFTFDDGLPSAYNTALPILAKYKMPATVYVVPGYVNDGAHMTWNQLFNLYWLYGWEIGNHTMHHLHFSQLTSTQILTEIKAAQNAFIAHGLLGSGAFTPPFGDMYDYVDYPLQYSQVLPLLKQVGFLTSSRVPWDDTDMFNVPDITFDPWKMNSCKLANPKTLADFKPLIDEAISQKKALMFTSHNLLALTNEEDGLNTATFQAVVNYVATQQAAGKVDVMPISKAVGKLMYYKTLP